MSMGLHFSAASIIPLLAMIIPVFLGADARGESAGLEVKKISLPTNDCIQRADMFYSKPGEGEARAVLVLCPGKNGNGEGWVKEDKWRRFASEHHLLLCGIWFESRQKTPEMNYSIPASGSGQLLLDGLKQIGAGKLPILIYGFSAGARFTASFVENHPDRILSWCACSVPDWMPQVETARPPPGVIACGESDAASHWASLQYFQHGRKLGRAWTWVSIPKTGHHRNVEFEGFVRACFTQALQDQNTRIDQRHEPEWRDIDTKIILTEQESRDTPLFSTFILSSEIAQLWAKIHAP